MSTPPPVDPYVVIPRHRDRSVKETEYDKLFRIKIRGQTRKRKIMHCRIAAPRVVPIVRAIQTVDRAKFFHGRVIERNPEPILILIKICIPSRQRPPPPPDLLFQAESRCAGTAHSRQQKNCPKKNDKEPSHTDKNQYSVLQQKYNTFYIQNNTPNRRRTHRSPASCNDTKMDIFQLCHTDPVHKLPCQRIRKKILFS